MLEVPKHILQKLLCAQCGGYLSNGPITINKQNEQICGKCFKILPDDKKSSCFRQSGLEAVAEILIFPCRYNIHGCTHTFQFDRDEDHEMKCPYRYNTLPLEEFLSMKEENVYEQPTEAEYSCDSEDLQIRMKCGNVYSSDYFKGEDKLRLKFDISGTNGSKFTITNSSTNQIKIDTVITCEILVSLEAVPKISFSYISLKNQTHENFYDSVSYLVQGFKCANCRKGIFNLEIYHCPFGHSLCKQCKVNVCVICGRVPNSAAQYCCKNFSKGCTQLFLCLDVKKHEIDCEFNNFKCPLADCRFDDTLNNLNQHFVKSHENRVVFSNELNVVLSQKDENWFFYCFGKLFHFKYFYFDDRLEFIVKYVGANDNAYHYRYEVVLLSEKFNNVNKQRTRCLGWNEIALAKAIAFDLQNEFRKKLEARLAILYVDDTKKPI